MSEREPNLEREKVIVRFDDERLRFEPQPDGSWQRFQETWTGTQWHTRGDEYVRELEIVQPPLGERDREQAVLE